MRTNAVAFLQAMERHYAMPCLPQHNPNQRRVLRLLWRPDRSKCNRQATSEQIDSSCLDSSYHIQDRCHLDAIHLRLANASMGLVGSGSAGAGGRQLTRRNLSL